MNWFVQLMLRRAEDALIRKHGVSRGFVREIMANNRAYRHDLVSISQWMWAVRDIQMRYPDDFALVGDVDTTW